MVKSLGVGGSGLVFRVGGGGWGGWGGGGGWGCSNVHVTCVDVDATLMLRCCYGDPTVTLWGGVGMGWGGVGCNNGHVT